MYRRRTEATTEDEDDVEFGPRKAIKLEDAANAAGNFYVILCLFYFWVSVIAVVCGIRQTDVQKIYFSMHYAAYHLLAHFCI